MPGKVASRSWCKDIVDVYNFLWGFLTWSYKFSIHPYCTMNTQYFTQNSGFPWLFSDLLILRFLSDFNASSFFCSSNDPDSLMQFACACQE